MEKFRQEVQQVRMMVAIRPSRSALYFIDVRAKVPFRFGKETLERVTCARVMFEVEEVSQWSFSRLGGVASIRTMGMAQRRSIIGARDGFATILL